MRVKCRSCGRKFDYEGCGGMCPKCSSYYQIDYRPEEDTFDEYFEDRNEYDNDGQQDFSYEEQAASSYVYERDETNQNAGKGMKGSIYTWCMIILMLAATTIPFITARVVDVAREKRNKGESSDVDRQEVTDSDGMQITSLGLGEAFPYEVVHNYNYEGKEERELYHICITGAKKDEELGKQMPEGYEMLAVSYEIEKEEAKEEKEQGDSSEVYSIYTNTYLLTKSGQYLYPMESYRMEELLNCGQQELKNRGIDSEFSFSKGLLYFMVKQDDAAGLRVYCQRFDYEDFQLTGIYAGYEILGLGGGNDE